MALKPCEELSVLVIATVSGIAVVDPASAVTLMDGRPTLSSGLVLTLSETGICKEVDVPGTVKTTLPLQTCGVSPEVVTDTTTWLVFPKVLPLAGVAVIKPLQLVVLVET